MDSKLLSGCVEMLLLETVSRAPTYGYAITQEVLQRSEGYFELKEGSLYPALHRMESQGWLESYWLDTEDGRRRKYYRLTALGATVCVAKRAEWERFSQAVGSVVRGNAAGAGGGARLAAPVFP